MEGVVLMNHQKNNRQQTQKVKENSKQETKIVEVQNIEQIDEGDCGSYRCSETK